MLSCDTEPERPVVPKKGEVAPVALATRHTRRFILIGEYMVVLGCVNDHSDGFLYTIGGTLSG